MVGDTSLSPEEYVGEYLRSRDCCRGCEPEAAAEKGEECESSD